jgi:hypothetical protein
MLPTTLPEKPSTPRTTDAANVAPGRVGMDNPPPFEEGTGTPAGPEDAGALLEKVGS